MSEIAKLRSRAADLDREIAKLDVLSSVHIDDVRSLLNKHVVDNLAELDVDQAHSTMTRLRDDIHRMRTLQEKKRDIERELAG